MLIGRGLAAMIASVKRQLAELLSDIGFVQGNLKTRDIERRGGKMSDGVAEAVGEGPDSLISRAHNLELVKAVLVAAMYPNGKTRQLFGFSISPCC